VKKVSIIIPVYNSVKYLLRCLESVCNQIYENLEIICVDDGSSDGSEKIVDYFAQKDKRIVAIHKKNGGESSARNVGLELCTGDYIGFIDCDDWIEPDMYLSLVKLLEKYEADIALSSYYLDKDEDSRLMKNAFEIQKNVWDRKKLLEYVYKRDSYRGVTSYIWSKLYRRSSLYNIYNEIVLFDEKVKHGGDLLFFAQIEMNINRAVYTPKGYYHYIQRASSTTHSDNLELWLEAVRTYIKLVDFFEAYNEYQEIVIWIKRFLVYRAQLVAELAYKQKNDTVLRFCQKYMRLYKNEYFITNQNFPERIKKYNQIRNY
jgi:glycosyltransferase involved in cell wall biosynthesis